MDRPQRKAPQPIYPKAILPEKYTETRRYEVIGAALDQRTLAADFIVPIRSGKGWRVRAGQVCRISTPEGPQVADLNFWNANDPAERFWAKRTFQIQGGHVRFGTRLWSCLPYLRPMLTITGDSIAYGVDEYGGRCHDLLGTRCDPYMQNMLSGRTVNDHCHSNLVNAAAEFGLAETDVHDVLNIFQVTGMVDDHYFIAPSPAKAGDYIEFLAEIDLIVAMSNCRGGDLSQERWGPKATDNLSGCRPLGVEIFALDPALLEGWESPEVSGYAGAHGRAST